MKGYRPYWPYKSLESDAQSLQHRIQSGEARAADIQSFLNMLRKGKKEELKRIAQTFGIPWQNDIYSLKIALDDKLTSLLVASKQNGPKASHASTSADKLLAAFNDIGRSHVDIADLRDAAGMSRGEFDQALYELRRKGVLTVSGYEGRVPLTDRQQQAAIKEDNSLIGWIARRR